VACIESSLALTVATAESVDGSSLYGERNILDAMLTMALDDPSEPTHQLLFVSALAKNRAYGSQIYEEYRRKAEKVVSDHPAPGAAGAASRATVASLYP